MNIAPPPPSPDSKVNDQYRTPKPKNLRDVPKYIKRVVDETSERMFYIIRLVWEANRGIMFLMAFMTLFNGVMPVIGSLISKDILNNLAKAYDDALTSFHIIAVLLIAQFVYLLLNDAMRRIYSTVLQISGELVANHIKIKLMNKSKEVDLSSYDSPEYYTKLENATREAARRPIESLTATFSIVSTVISIVSYVIVILVVGILPALIIVAVAIPSTLVNFYFRRKNYDYMFRCSSKRRQLVYYSELVTNKDLVKEMRTLNLTDTFTEKYQTVFDVYFKGLKKLKLRECLWSLLASVISTAVNCVLFVMIAEGVFEGKYEVGNYALYTGALTAISTGISTLITTTASIYESTLFINNMISFMKEEPKIVPCIHPPRKVERGVGHTIVFEHVSFRYPGTERDVLQDINLTISPGELVVFVGLNGAGKTTLIKLLMRLYDPTDGMILLDGHDIREYDVTELYDMFGIVFQDYGKYAVSVRENIAFGEVMKDIVDDEIEKAALHSNAKEFIEELPDKYDTSLMRYFDENGTELSIGQWQKIAIARAFYADSDILILDEPTASLDAIAEQEIFAQFENLREGKSSIFVSHRLSSATTANKIVVLNNGTVEEIGNHAELMAAHGEYYKLFSTQAKRYQTPQEHDRPPFPLMHR